MDIKSIGLLSDLLFYKLTSNIVDKGNYLKIETPENPDYYWGNLLLFQAPPKENDFLEWIKLFNEEFKNNQSINHMTFTWDIFGDKPAIDKFVQSGFVFEETIVLMTPKLNLKYQNLDYLYKEIETDKEWDAVMELQIDIGIETEGYKIEKYRPFVEKKFQDYKELVRLGHGKWFGAFLNGELVADLGIFGNEDFKRFQSIETKKDYRKKGIAQNLMTYASVKNPAKVFILQASQRGPAIDMYMSIGFEIKEVISCLCLYDKSKLKLE
jgi:ribosomal protein S18 acetylase RimI-like enzyme